MPPKSTGAPKHNLAKNDKCDKSAGPEKSEAIFEERAILSNRWSFILFILDTR